MKLKVQLKLAIARLRMIQQRDEQLGKTQRRAMAQLLEQGKIDSAKIRVENIIRTDIISELHEMLELYCELLLARSGLMEGPIVDPGLEEAIQSIIYAAPKTEIKELGTVRSLFAEKYGKEYVLGATDNTEGKVNERVIRKLSVEPPKQDLVQGYLEEIAKAYGVDWPKRERPETPPDLLDADDFDDDEGEEGGVKERISEAPIEGTTSRSAKDDLREEDISQATPPRHLVGGPKSPLTVTPPRMTTENVHPKVTHNSMELKPNAKMDAASSRASGRKNEPEGSVPDISDLERRFAALKKK